MTAIRLSKFDLHQLLTLVVNFARKSCENGTGANGRPTCNLCEMVNTDVQSFAAIGSGKEKVLK